MWGSLILINYSASPIILDLSCSESLLSSPPSCLSTAVFLGQGDFKDAFSEIFMQHKVIAGAGLDPCEATVSSQLDMPEAEVKL